MRKTFFLMLLTAVCLGGFAQDVQDSINVQIGPFESRRALLYLPDDYNSTTSNYPLLIFLHGGGESGNDLKKIYNSPSAGGPAYMIEHNQWPATGFVNPADGQTYKFIVVSPQASGWGIGANNLEYIIPYLIANYRINTNRIYIMGISFGGEGLINYAGRQGITPTYKPAAVAPLSAVINTASINSIANNMVTDGVRAWGQGQPSCDGHATNTKAVTDAMAAAQPGISRFTTTTGCHSTWNAWILPTYREPVGGTNMSIYEWMLQFQRGASNLPPTVNAGTDQTTAGSSVTLTATASDADGTIASYSWTKISGGAATIVSPSAASTSITGLAAGAYTFRVTVTDNNGATATDDVNVTVSTNQAPTVNAGSDQTTSGTSVTLTATASDADGTIASYSWTKISGGSATIASPAAASTSVTALVAGSYTFRITVTDNNGATASDDVNVTVTSSSNQSPVVNAGANQTITLPTNVVTLTATASDPDGTIATYSWTKISGGSANIFSPSAASTIVNSLSVGTYVFRMTVTDNNGATASDDLTVTVNPAPKIAQVNLYGNNDPANLSDWNDWNVTSSLSRSNLSFTDASAGTWDVSISAHGSLINNGTSYTGFTMCPNKIGQYASANSTSRTLTISDLDVTKQYALSFIASVSSITSSTVFNINGSTVTVAVGNNKSTSASFGNIAPNSSGVITITISNAGGSTSNYLNGFKIQEQASSGSRIALQPAPATITMGPNPAQNQVTIVTTEPTISWIRIFDVQGRLRKQQRFGNSSTANLNVSDLLSGIYFVEIQQGNRSTKRILNIKR